MRDKVLVNKELEKTKSLLENPPAVQQAWPAAHYIGLALKGMELNTTVADLNDLRRELDSSIGGRVTLY
jgi:hypothetical protein